MRKVILPSSADSVPFLDLLLLLVYFKNKSPNKKAHVIHADPRVHGLFPVFLIFKNKFPTLHTFMFCKSTFYIPLYPFSSPFILSMFISNCCIPSPQKKNRIEVTLSYSESCFFMIIYNTLTITQFEITFCLNM